MMNAYLRAGPYRDTDFCQMALIFIGSTILMTNCNLFKNTATDLQQSHALSTAVTQVKSTEQKDYLSKSGSVSFYQDSSNHDYSIQIWPRGAFTFSPEMGFSGQADKLLVTGKDKSRSVSSDKRSTFSRDKGRKRMLINEQKKSIADEKSKVEKTSASWKWMIAGLVFMGGIGCFFYTKVKLLYKS